MDSSLNSDPSPSTDVAVAADADSVAVVVVADDPNPNPDADPPENAVANTDSNNAPSNVVEEEEKEEKNVDSYSVSNTNNNNNNNNNNSDNNNDSNNNNSSHINDPNKDPNEIPQALEGKPLGRKNRIVIGSFEASTFHYSFKNRRDPLDIKMFPIFGYLCVPHIGVYGSSFEPTALRTLIEVKVTESLITTLPVSISNEISGIVNKLHTTIDQENQRLRNQAQAQGQAQAEQEQEQPEQEQQPTFVDIAKPKVADILSIYVAVHARPPSRPCQHFKCDSNTEINLMYHPWFYGNAIQSMDSDQQINDTLWTGVFEPENVFAAHIEDVNSAVDRGMPFGTLEQRACALHGFAFSPCNMHVGRVSEYEAGFCAFYSLAARKDYSECVLSYHVFGNNRDTDELIQMYMKQIKTVEELLNVFEGLALGNVHKNLKLLCAT